MAVEREKTLAEHFTDNIVHLENLQVDLLDAAQLALAGQFRCVNAAQGLIQAANLLRSAREVLLTVRIV